MDKKLPETDAATEENLIRLIATLRIEPVEEANYEERFLSDFRERIARDAVCCPARLLLWEHCKQFFANVGMRRWVYGTASTCGIAALVVAGILVHQPEGAPLAVASVKAPRMSQASEAPLPLLASPTFPDRFTCISVCGEKTSPITQNHRAISGNARFFETEAIIISEPGGEAFPVKSDFATENEPTFFSVTILPVGE